MNPNIPLPGEIVTIVTGFQCYVIGREGWEEKEYKDVVVLEPARIDPPNTFRFLVPHTPIPERLVNMRSVERLKRGNSTYRKVKPRKITHNRTAKQIANSKGTGFYTVALENNVAIHCTCPGFTYRKNCRHLKEATND